MSARAAVAARPAMPAGPRMASLRIAGAVTAAYLLAFGAALAWRLAGDIGDAILCVAPAIAGALLAATAQADRKQYMARMLAAGAFLPVLLMMWASSHEHAGLWLLAFVAVHVAAFLALILWLASLATRIEPAQGVAPVGEETLLRRLASLARRSGPLRLVPAPVRSRIQFDLLAGERAERSHRVILDVDAAHRAVSVRERLGAHGAAPRDESEADMRTGGEPWFDPSRPEAQRAWTRTLQSTMIDPERLDRVELRIELDRVDFEWPAAGPPDGDAVMTLLAATVTRSGYSWRPRLLPGGKPAAGEPA